MESSRKLELLKSDVLSLQGERQYVVKNIKRLRKKYIGHVKNKDMIERAVFVLQLLSESRQKSIIELFEQTVTAALQEVFNERYAFKLQYGKRNNVATVDFMIHTGEYEGFLPIKMTQGNSVSQVVGTILRLMFISVLEGRKFAVLDESLGGVEIDRESRVGAFLRTICDRFKIQLLMVTHKTGIYESADNKILME